MMILLILSFLLHLTAGIFLKDFIYVYLERGEGREKRGRETSMCERYIYWLPLTHPQLGNLAQNPGMCPDWESNP